MNVADPGSGDQGETFAGTSAGIVWASVAGPSSRVTEGTDDVPVTETSGGIAAESSSEASQYILGRFAEEWLETLDKEETKSLSMFLCYQLVHRVFLY